MRNVVLALVVANVLYFAWAYWRGDNGPALTAVALRERPATEPAPVPPACATLGPFTDEVLAESADTALAAAGLPAQRRSVPVEVNDGWWVYVTSDSAAAQARALDTVRRQVQRDAFAIPDDAQFRVSVGVFTDPQRAEERAERLRGVKLEPVVEERLKESEQTWFDVTGVAPEALSDGRLENLDLPLLDLRIEACPAQ